MSLKELGARLKADFKQARVMYLTILFAVFVFPVVGLIFWPHFYTDFLVVIFYAFILWEIVNRLQAIFRKGD